MRRRTVERPSGLFEADRVDGVLVEELSKLVCDASL